MKKRILVLEDELINQRVIQFMLATDFHIDIVENGKEAFEWLKENTRPDLIIMDWIMPIMDGKSFLYALCESEINIDTPIIILSSYEHVHGELAEIPLQTHAQLKKPIESHVLKTAISSAIFY
jgi:CheY-like chemotaxis protein